MKYKKLDMLVNHIITNQNNIPDGNKYLIMACLEIIQEHYKIIGKDDSILKQVYEDIE